jgi:hypothetical protein
MVLAMIDGGPATENIQAETVIQPVYHGQLAAREGRVDTLKQAPESWKHGGQRRRPSILSSNGRISALSSACGRWKLARDPHGGQFCQRQGNCRSPKANQDAPIDHGRRAAICQSELECDGKGLPGGKENDAEIDNGRQVDVSLERY